MGKGDKKSKRGKIIMGSYGVRRMRKASKTIAGKAIEVVEEVKPAEETKAKTPKKPAAPKKKKEDEAATE